MEKTDFPRYISGQPDAMERNAASMMTEVRTALSSVQNGSRSNRIVFTQKPFDCFQIVLFRDAFRAADIHILLGFGHFREPDIPAADADLQPAVFFRIFLGVLELGSIEDVEMDRGAVAGEIDPDQFPPGRQTLNLGTFLQATIS